MLLFIREIKDSNGAPLPDVYVKFSPLLKNDHDLALALYRSLNSPQTPSYENYNRRSLPEKLLLRADKSAPPHLLGDAHYEEINFVISQQSMLISNPKTGDYKTIAEFINNRVEKSLLKGFTRVPPMFISKDADGVAYLNSTEAMSYTFFTLFKDMSPNCSADDVTKLIGMGEAAIKAILEFENRDMPNIREAIEQLKSRIN